MQHSQDNYRRRGGDLGHLSREGRPGIPDVVIEVAFSLEPGEISPVFSSAGGYNLILVESHSPSTVPAFSMLKKDAVNEMADHKSAGLRQRFIAELQTQFEVVIFEDRLDAFSPHSDAP